MKIRSAEHSDCVGVRSLYLAAFPANERELVASLAVRLLVDESGAETMALVAEENGDVVGHICFSALRLKDTNDVVGSILAPLAVHPDWQRQGIGTKLVDAGLERVSLSGVPLVFVYGDPQYYQRFGFDTDLAKRYRPPYRLQFEFGWQAKAITYETRIPRAAELTCVEPLMDPQLW